MSDQYSFWRKALELAGDCGELTREQPKLLGATMEPESGFYRKRKHKDGPFVPVAIWRDGNGILGVVNGKQVPAEDELWTRCCRHPVSEKSYYAATETGAWPDDVPTAAPAIGHNSGADPDDPHAALTQEYEREAEAAQEFLQNPITEKQQADMAAAWSKRIAAIAKKATDLHKVEKQPALDECRRIDDRWRDLKDGAKELSTAIKRALDNYLREEARKEEERQRKAAAEALAKQREAEAAARKAAAFEAESQAEKLAARAEAERLQREADEAAKATETRNASAGRTGSKVALRTFVTAKITDIEALLMALKERPEIVEVAQKLANSAVRQGKELPGVERVEERRAA